MEVTLIDKMGTDLTVVNAARFSFGKKKKKFTDGDARLISYLARHNHWTPFGHCSLQFHIVAPVFVARQLVKHQVGLVWNEISRRYVDTDPEFYIPEKWRLRAEDKSKEVQKKFTIMKIHLILKTIHIEFLHMKLFVRMQPRFIRVCW